MCDCYGEEFEMADVEEEEREPVPILVVPSPRKRVTRT
jgi:hypothetical protein